MTQKNKARDLCLCILTAFNGKMLKGLQYYFDVPSPMEEAPFQNSLQGDLFISSEDKLEFKGIYLLQKQGEQCLVRIKKSSNDNKTFLQLKAPAVLHENSNKEVLVFNLDDFIAIMQGGYMKIMRPGVAIVASMMVSINI